MNEIRGLQAWMRILANQDLPTLSTIVKDICALSDKDDCRTDDLTKIILRDADLTSKVLKISNSIHYNRSFTPIRTVSRAIVQLGFNNLKSITLATTLIDTFLKGKPKQQLIQCLAKCFHAAVQAKALVPYLDAELQEQVFIAALLRNIGELALLSSGRETVEKFVTARDLNPKDQHRISQEYLGVDIDLINKQLIQDWALGELAYEAAGNPSSANNMVRAINMGNALSKYIHAGANSQDMMRIYAQVGALCDISIHDAKKQVAQMAEETAVIAKSYGADMLLSEMPHFNDDDADVVVVEPAPTGYALQQHLNYILKLMFEDGDLSKIMQCSVVALHEGSGMARIMIAMLDYKSKSMDVRYISGKGTSVWRQQVRIELDKLHKGELLHDFLCVQQPCWYQPIQEMKPIGALKALNDRIDVMLAPLKIDKRLIAILYADNAGQTLSPRQFEDFQLIANQLNLFLRVNMPKPKT